MQSVAAVFMYPCDGAAGTAPKPCTVLALTGVSAAANFLIAFFLIAFTRIDVRPNQISPGGG